MLVCHGQSKQCSVKTWSKRNCFSWFSMLLLFCVLFFVPIWPISPFPCRMSTEGRDDLWERWAPATPAASSAQLADCLSRALLSLLPDYSHCTSVTLVPPVITCLSPRPSVHLRVWWALHSDLALFPYNGDFLFSLFCCHLSLRENFVWYFDCISSCELTFCCNFANKSTVDLTLHLGPGFLVWHRKIVNN